MRVVIAMIKHETNTFSPVPTPLTRFGVGEPALHADARRLYEGTGTAIGAFIDLARASDAEIVTPIAAEAWPSGPASAQTFATLTDPILAAVNQGCDAVLLDLHGAMVTENEEDAEGHLIEAVRRIAPNVPIGVALDFHANVTERMVANATSIAGFHTYPHLDLYETGLRAGRTALGALSCTVRPVLAWGQRPMIPHIMRQATADSPMHDLVETAKRYERDGALSVSVFGGFPHADIHDAGLSIVAVTDGDEPAARAICTDLLDRAWQSRAEFIYHGKTAQEAIEKASKLDLGPILLLDHCDNCGSGGTQDVMTVLREILRQGLTDVAAFAIHDPAAVETMAAAGVGAKVSLSLGGKYPIPEIGVAAEPLAVTGKVRSLSNGEFRIRGPMYTGVEVSMGRTAVLDTGGVEIVVIERHHEPWDPDCLRFLGIEPTAKRFIMLKSRVHWQAGFLPLVRHVVECSGPGATTSDFGRLPFKRLRRPIFPLDPDAVA